MITNFEEYTKELNKEERKLIPLIIRGLATYTKEKPIFSKDIVIGFNKYLEEKGIELEITGARLRKCLNCIRKNGLAPIIGTSKGYYTSFDKEEIAKQIKSLEERSNSIMSCARGLKKFL